MLRELHIRNLAVIEDAAFEFGDGVTCFTGETGAGKSLVLGAFELLLGLRGGKQMIREGAEQARVTGVFELHDAETCREIGDLLGLDAAELPPGEQLMIQRRINSRGRSTVRVNGEPATASMVRRMGELLVDIHGQHDHQSLLRPAQQRAILDDFGEAGAIAAEVAEAHKRLAELRERRERLAANESLRKEREELYGFQAREIDDVAPEAGEYPELKARQSRLRHVEKLRRESGEHHAALYESEGAVVDRLQGIARGLERLAELDPALAETAEQVRSASVSLEEAAFELGRYVERLDVDPAELESAEARLDALHGLIRKYAQQGDGEDPVTAVIAYRRTLDERLEALRAEAGDHEAIDREIEAARTELAEKASRLTEARRRAAEVLAPRITEQIRALGMPEAALEVALDPLDEIGPAGAEAVTLRFRANPGQSAQPLRRVASGGELSRIMLALKAVLAGSDRVSVLVFDEIDANIGGRMGTVIGQKLAELAAAGHQVVCITHLPQIAAYANRHLRVAKAFEGEGAERSTRTRVDALEGDDRTEELAEMLAGQKATETTRKQARELVEAAGGASA